MLTPINHTFPLIRILYMLNITNVYNVNNGRETFMQNILLLSKYEFYIMLFVCTCINTHIGTIANSYLVIHSQLFFFSPYSIMSCHVNIICSLYFFLVVVHAPL